MCCTIYSIPPLSVEGQRPDRTVARVALAGTVAAQLVALVYRSTSVPRRTVSLTLAPCGTNPTYTRQQLP